MFQIHQPVSGGLGPHRASLRGAARQNTCNWPLAFLLFTIGCGQPASGRPGPDLSGLDRTDSLTGIDADANGIRDDIDTYLEREYSDDRQRAAVQQFARAMQKSLLAGPGDVSAAKQVVQQGMRAINCISSRFPKGGWKEAAQVETEIEGLTTNTKRRLLAHLQTCKTLDGTSWALPEGDTCE